MISSLCWVPRGAAKALPLALEPTEDELAEAELAAAADHSEESDDIEDEEQDQEDSDSDADMSGEAAVQRARAVASSIARGEGGDVAAGSIEAAMRELDMDHYDDSDEENVVARVLGGRRGGLASMAVGYITV